LIALPSLISWEGLTFIFKGLTMKRKKDKKDPYGEYHRKAWEDEILGIAFVLASSLGAISFLVLFLKHFPLK